jgi:hypothetical protein
MSCFEPWPQEHYKDIVTNLLQQAGLSLGQVVAIVSIIYQTDPRMENESVSGMVVKRYLGWLLNCIWDGCYTVFGMVVKLYLGWL